SILQRDSEPCNTWLFISLSTCSRQAFLSFKAVQVTDNLTPAKHLTEPIGLERFVHSYRIKLNETTARASRFYNGKHSHFASKRRGGRLPVAGVGESANRGQGFTLWRL